MGSSANVTLPKVFVLLGFLSFCFIWELILSEITLSWMNGPRVLSSALNVGYSDTSETVPLKGFKCRFLFLKITAPACLLAIWKNGAMRVPFDHKKVLRLDRLDSHLSTYNRSRKPSGRRELNNSAARFRPTWLANIQQNDWNRCALFSFSIHFYNQSIALNGIRRTARLIFII